MCLQFISQNTCSRVNHQQIKKFPKLSCILSVKTFVPFRCVSTSDTDETHSESSLRLPGPCQSFDDQRLWSCWMCFIFRLRLCHSVCGRDGLCAFSLLAGKMVMERVHSKVSRMKVKGSAIFKETLRYLLGNHITFVANCTTLVKSRKLHSNQFLLVSTTIGKQRKCASSRL